ncbi:MAG: aminotransferase class III-fold pyridoxal phosphate-dependent enzyme [Granulosicoccus sp.]
MNKSAEKLDMRELVELDRSHIWHHLTPHKSLESKDPLVIVKGDGMRVWDQNGKEYLDAVSGAVWTVNVGYGRESIADAVRDQLVEMCYFAGTAGNVPGIKYAEKLISKMPGMSRVYYANSGSEANEKGYKIVRQIAAKENGGKKHKILYRDRDYHGTTITALSTSGQNERKAQYGPFTPGFVEVPHCCEYRSQFPEDSEYGVRIAREIEKIILQEDPDTVGSIVLEPVTAGGGVILPPEGYWETVQEICTKYGLLLHMDEVVCGVGRTGKWFGYQHYGIKPDIVTMAKGVASGYAAIACTVTTEAVFDKFKDSDDPMGYFRDISTFGGCAAGPAAALETMRIIEDENLLDNVTEMGEYLMEKLRGLQNKYKVIGDVRGKGLFCGMELVKDRQTKEPVHENMLMSIAADCMQQGVIVGRTNRSLSGLNNTVCLSPALICTPADIDQIVESLDSAMGRHAMV